ncbi:hypothetical protein [Enterovirga sp.]|uniref:hypothetical protein n=1 Tax=Enterovirga sp. TaxID=2026350 RepID=UPI002BF7D406|nr:hypothetical protein [Enterovirga sp.]HMO29839.1 hypothetical protein [Enterovirga sp.]
MVVKLSSKLDAFVRKQGTLRPPPLARTTDPYWLSYADLGRLEQILAPKMPRADVGYRLQQIAVGYARQKARRAKARDLANRASSLRALADAAARIDKALKRVDEDDLIWSFEDIKFDFELLHEEADDGTVQFSDRKFEEFADAVLAQIDITREVARDWRSAPNEG